MNYGLAIDIGTTNIKAVKVCLQTGEIAGECCKKNSQSRFGKDVLSRIRQACLGQQEQLKQLVWDDILEMMRQMHAELPAQVAIACNTTMMALLCGDSVKGMQEFPFQPERLMVPEQRGVRIAPAAGAFIGGDVMAGLSVLPKEKTSFLFIDLGTNGEMVLRGKEHLLAVSAAAGPAFEYMVDASGSMLLEALKDCYRSGIVDETGLLEEEWFETGYLWNSVDGEKEFLLTQQKIRDLQLAKAAIRTGVDYLLQKYRELTGLEIEPEAVYLAGGMGVVSEDACIAIGMLPKKFQGKCRFLGNTALFGAVKLLLEPESFLKMQQLAKATEVHNLAAWEEFNERFIENINFPER